MKKIIYIISLFAGYHLFFIRHVMRWTLLPKIISEVVITGIMKPR